MKHSKWERLQCPHGRFRWQRWIWHDNQTIEDSDFEFSNGGCKVCDRSE